ncbi:MAG: hypothetical protein H0V81_11010 [Solirubrobacterales bacterium]|nr:hypothetical protein [Solirubrobacterales bacterium]
MKSTIRTGVLAGVLTLAVAAPAFAGPTVTVRVEGQAATLLPETTVTLPDVKAAGNPCGGADATRTVAAALEEATKGNWDRQQFTSTILDESHTFANNDYWAEWVNEKYGGGVCADTVQTGDRVLFLVDVSGANFEPTVFPMTLAAPATVAPGTPFSVRATEYTNATGNPGEGTASDASGVSITGAAAAATTGADGRASVRLDARGPTTLRASRANGSRSVPVAVCVTDGADGFCATAKPGAPAPAAASPTFSGPLFGGDNTSSFAKITTLQEQKTYELGEAPRELKGTVDDDLVGVDEVRLRISRKDGGRCFKYIGSSDREEFVRTRKCSIKSSRTFKVGEDRTWEYLLPKDLEQGRYVLDVIVKDRAGNQTKTYQRGRNRVVFYVK